MDVLQPIAAQWVAWDRDVETLHEMRELVAQGNYAELEKRLATRIAFGTAGLRARMEAGFSRMNSLTVIQTSQGFASYLAGSVNDARHRGVVIGHDARFNSEKFAKVTAAVFATAGYRVLLFQGNVHTPLVPFSVATLKAAAGVMITASHNPAQDNGYKVYWSNGCQIIPPHDAGIAESILHNLEPLSWELENAPNKGLVERVPLELEHNYHASIRQLVSFTSLRSLPRFVYTPMHGVGLQRFLACFAFLSNLNSTTELLQQKDTNGQNQFLIVPEQATPDPTFSTVKFPNPEEKGALDLAVRTADGNGIDMIIATDPDADRFAVAERLPEGDWHQFTGNEVGVLLAAHLLESRYPQQDSRKKLTMLCSTVSTGMLRTMAETEGFDFVETLTGFKWLGNVAQSLATEHERETPFAFEEALGYMFPSVVHDKDGICTSAVFLDAASRWKATANVTPLGRLQQLYEKYGYFADANTYLISPGPEVTKKVFSDIRVSSAITAESTALLGGKRILRWRDLTTGFDTGTADNVPDLPIDKSSEMITCELEGQTRFTVRGSGTEPKIKLYIESRAITAQEAKREALAIQDALINEWFKPEKYNLIPA